MNSTPTGEAPRPAPRPVLDPPAPPRSSSDPDHIEALFTELGQKLEDERSRNRHREAVFLSVIVHLCILILFILNPKLPNWLTSTPSPLLVNPQQLVHKHQLTYLVSPYRPPKPKHKVHSNVLSDRDRLYKHPQRRLLDSFAGPAAPPMPRRPPARALRPRRAIRPSPPRIAAAAPHPAQPVVKAPKAQTAGKTPGPGTANGGLRLQNVPRTPRRADLTVPIPGMSAADQLKRAIQAAARSQTQGGQGVAQMGQMPSPAGMPSTPSPGGNGDFGDAVRILTNTEGVNFHSWLQQVIEEVRQNWLAVMPEAFTLGRKGRTIVFLEVNRRGKLTALKLVSPSGTLSFDQAAIAGINASNPFPPLPNAFHGPFIALQFGFFYNMNPYQSQAAQ